MILFRELAEVFQKLECISSNTVLVGIVATFLSRLNPDETKAVAYLVGEVAAPFESLEIGIAERMAALMKLGVPNDTILEGAGVVIK